MPKSIDKNKPVAIRKRKGRPPLIIDPQRIRDMVTLQATKEEMAGILGCSVDLLYDRFGDIIKRGYSEGKVSLRREQWKAVLRGNVQMMIHLGKNWLGQRDTQPDEVAHTLIQIQVNNEP